MLTHPATKTHGLLALALLIGLTCAPAISSQTSDAHDKPVVLSAEMQDRRVVYKIDGENALPDLLRALDLVAERRGHDVGVIVLLDSRASFAEFGNIEGTLGKAGLSKIHFFVFNKAARIMSSVEFGKTVPYSLSPPWE